MAVELPRSAVEIVARERILAEQSTSILVGGTRQLVRAEAQLVERYVKWVGPEASKLSGMLIPVGRTTLRVDLFHTTHRVLIEAKAKSSREFIRYAIGQLFDYQRRIAPRPRLAVLLPARPAGDMLDLLAELQIKTIYEAGRRFEEA